MLRVNNEVMIKFLIDAKEVTAAPNLPPQLSGNPASSKATLVLCLQNVSCVQETVAIDKGQKTIDFPHENKQTKQYA